MRAADRIFTEQVLSQVEAYLQGYGSEFTGNNTWTFLNVSTVYWHIFRRWQHLQCAAGMESLEEPVEETVLLEEAGQRISFLQAYMHRGRLLEDLALYDYMSIVMLKRKRKSVAA
jgi:hypothetical protein